MDYTQLSEFRSYQPEILKDVSALASTTHGFNGQDNMQDFFKIIKNLDEINHTRSLPNSFLNIMKTEVESQQMIISKSEELQIESDHKTEQLEQKTQQTTSRILFKSPQSALKLQNSIKIFHQSSQQFLTYHFERDTLVKEVIGAVLLIFAIEPANKYFKNYILNPEQYSLRMSSPEGKDLQSYSKIRMYNLNNVFLVNRARMKSQAFKQQQKQDFTFEIVISIYNEQYAQVLKITLGIQDKLEKLYKKIQRNRNFSRNKYLLTQSLETEIELPKDMLIKELTFPTIYIKARRFADETQEDRVKPFTLIINNQTQVNELGPISITEASMYEQYEVVKVNKFGKQQERILGVDQMKIYNYQKRVRKYNKDVSLLGMIRGLDKIAGTKHPFMKIEDLLSLKQDPNECKLTLKFKDKQQIYYLKSTVTLAKLSRKLLFLVQYHTGCV